MRASLWNLKVGMLALVMGVAQSSSAGGPVAKPVPPCGLRPEIFTEPAQVIHTKNLPKALMVGRIAEVWIESKDGQMKLHARHNFKSGQKEFLCATLPPSRRENFSFPLLTLLDRSEQKSTGDALWQFQVMVNGSQLGLWSQKSGLLKTEDFVDKPRGPWKTEFFTSFLEEYRLRSGLDLGETELFSVIRYDLISADSK